MRSSRSRSRSVNFDSSLLGVSAVLFGVSAGGGAGLAVGVATNLDDGGTTLGLCASAAAASRKRIPAVERTFKNLNIITISFNLLFPYSRLPACWLVKYQQASGLRYI